MESFKTYEHVLSEESVVEHFRNIINKAKKFAKPELKSCIEEFEDKLNKFHLEKKEQEQTARNAQAHQQKVCSLKGYEEAKVDSREENAGEVTEDGAGDVIDPCREETITPTHYVKPEADDVESEESSCLSGVMTEAEAETDDMESQSAKSSRAGISKFKTKKSTRAATKEQTASGYNRRQTRSSKGLVSLILDSSFVLFPVLDDRAQRATLVSGFGGRSEGTQYPNSNF
ncbi:hypothetical protein ACLOJK_000478 [Asimina triloba]